MLQLSTHVFPQGNARLGRWVTGLGRYRTGLVVLTVLLSRSIGHLARGQEARSYLGALYLGVIAVAEEPSERKEGRKIVPSEQCPCQAGEKTVR